MQGQKLVIGNKYPGFYMDKYNNKTRLVTLRNYRFNYWQEHGVVHRNFVTCSQAFMNTSSGPCCKLLMTLVW